MFTPRVLVASTFEAELQPLAAAAAAAALRDQGLAVTGWDAHFLPDSAPSGPFDLVLLSVQQFEGLERAWELARRLRDDGMARTIVAFGQYAQLNAGKLLERVDGVAFDEPERISAPLADLARGRLAPAEVPALLTRQGMRPRPPRRRLALPAPARDLFPPLVLYPAHHTGFGLMGNLEASRGCHHRCTYCSVYGAYGGGVAPYEVEAVVADALRLADEGVRHFCFIDAEFFNSRTIGPEIIKRIAAEVRPCTFELTTRVDHLLTHTAELERLVALGLRRVTSALEFPSDRVLRIFDKGITVQDMRAAIAAARQLGITLNPTFIPFNPWVEYDELLRFEDFLVETDLARVADPTVLQTRLLLYKGSPLLASPWIEDLPLADQGFWFEWTHPDVRVEELWAQRRADAERTGKVRCCVKC